MESCATLDASYAKGRVYTLPKNIANGLIKFNLLKPTSEMSEKSMEKPIAKLIKDEETKEGKAGEPTEKAKRKYTPRKTQTKRAKKTKE